MPVFRLSGNLVHDPAEMLVNTVNCVGVMGKGLALAFARTFPEILPPYKAACRSGALDIGKIQIITLSSGQLVVNFPTKLDWRNPSKLEWIPPALDALAEEIATRHIKSIAVPPLGCGLGGLRWADVEPLILAKLETLPGVDIHLYPPRAQ